MKNTILLAILLSSSAAFAQTEQPAEEPTAQKPKVEAKTEAKPEAKAETKPEVKAAKAEEKVKAEAAEGIPKEEVKAIEAPTAVTPPVVAKEATAKKSAPVADDGFDNSWNVHLDLLAGSYDSTGNSSLTFANAGQYPTLASGEKLPMDVKSPTSGFQLGGGYRFNRWLSWDMNFLMLGAKKEGTITTSTGATHDLKLETGFLYFSPLTWTAYPIKWLYVQAGVGLVVEAHKVTTNINNIGSFETGSYGHGINLGTGVEFALSKMFTLRGGLTLISAATITQEKKLNEGQASEVTAKWEDRKIGIGLLTFGTKIYF